MSAINGEWRNKAIQWIEYAEEDLLPAKHALSIPAGCPYRLVAYHAQQCAGKYLKAFLVFHGKDFPHTHDIGHLLKLGETVSPWDKAIYQAEELTPYAVSARYPGEDETVASEDAILLPWERGHPARKACSGRRIRERGPGWKPALPRGDKKEHTAPSCSPRPRGP